MTLSRELVGLLRRIATIALAVGVVAAFLCFVGYRSEPERLYAAYLTAFMFWLGISLGCLGIAMLHGLTGGAWGTPIRRIVEAGYQTLPLLAVGFAPFWFGVERIYEWADPELVRGDAILSSKSAYLNVAGFHARVLACFAIWIVVSLLLTRSSPDDRPTGDSHRAGRQQAISGVGFILYGYSLTVASVDWVMSLEPHWYSTMYGVLYLAGQAVAGMSFSILAVSALGRFEPWSRLVTPERRHDLGNLLLAFVMFWAYVSFMQYLIIWSGNLPEENVWYLHRSAAGWHYLAMALMSLHFAVPFLLLLSRRTKRQASGICRVAALLLVMRYIDLYWLIVPGFHHESSAPPGFSWHWLDAAALAAIGGFWLATFVWRLAARAKMPIFDPDFKEAIDERFGPTAVA